MNNKSVRIVFTYEKMATNNNFCYLLDSYNFILYFYRNFNQLNYETAG